MKQGSIMLSAAVFMAALMTMSFTSRTALSLVAKTCKANSAITGSPFPCLKVVSSSIPLAGYAIVREPGDDQRTILTPLDDIAGIEDPRLLLPNAPNYFQLAWEERTAVTQKKAMKNDAQKIALAINAAINRSQDQLHIHIGCVGREIEAALWEHRARISDTAFESLDFRIGRRIYWARFVTSPDLNNANPFQLVAAGVPGARQNMGRVTIAAIAGSGSNGRDGFYILAEVMNSRSRSLGAAEDLIDVNCNK